MVFRELREDQARTEVRVGPEVRETERFCLVTAEQAVPVVLPLPHNRPEMAARVETVARVVPVRMAAMVARVVPEDWVADEVEMAVAVEMVEMAGVAVPAEMVVPAEQVAVPAEQVEPEE